MLKIKILLVEDDSAAKETIMGIINKAHNKFEITSVATLKEAKKILSEKPIDVILTNYNLPDGAAPELALNFPRIPMIILTDSENEKIAADCLKAGAYDYIVKDFSEEFGEKLLRMINEVLKQYRDELEFLAQRRAAQKLSADKSLANDEKESDDREQILRGIVESAKDAVICVNGEGKVVFWNPGAAEIFGYGENETLGKPIQNLIIAAKDRAKAAQKIPVFGKTGKGNIVGRTIEYEAVNKAGERFPVELSLSSFKIGGQWFAAAIIRDIRERKKREQKLLQTQKLEAIGRLAGGIAHDFNNVLTVVRGYCDLILHALDRDTPLYKQIEAINSAAQYAESITRQLLVFSQKSPVKAQSLNVKDVYLNLEKFLNKTLGENCKVIDEFENDLHPIYGDPAQVEQMMINLILNACNAVAEGGTVYVKASNRRLTKKELPATLNEISPGDYVQIQIHDTGSGMSEEQRQHIFEPFFTTDKRERGSGLGLSVVYGIVKEMKGFIECQSEINKGTIFNILIPAFKKKDEKASAKAKGELVGGKETILVVEDQKEILILLQEILGAVGYKTIGKGTGQEALQYYKQHGEEIDLLLVDVVLPDFYGTELVKKIQQTNPEIKYIFMSGYTDKLDWDNNMELLKGRFIQKPFLPERLLQLVRGVLDSR